MFPQFERTFRPDIPIDLSASRGQDLNAFLARYGGRSYERGLYRVFAPRDVAAWDALLSKAFPEFAGSFECFGYDWRGCIFALDLTRGDAGSELVIAFDPGTGQVLDIEVPLAAFHEALAANADELLGKSDYDAWLRSGRPAPRADQCVGLDVPLFLGGTEDWSNQRVSDMQVMWSIHGQILTQLAGVPPGTKINLQIDG